MIGCSTSHFQSSFSLRVLAAVCVCEEEEEARGSGIGVGMKVGHLRFCLVARQNSRLTLTPLNGGRVLHFTDAVLRLLACSRFVCATSAMLANQHEATSHRVLVLQLPVQVFQESFGIITT